MELKVTEATVRKKLKLMCIPKQPNGRMLVNDEQYKDFLYRFYPSIYAKTNRCVLAVERTLMDTKKLNKGKIQKIIQKSGNIYYYIRNFPIGFDENGNTIYYHHNVSYKTKEEAMTAREELVIKRSKGLLTGTAKETPKEQSYYQYCYDYVNGRENELAYGTFKNYLLYVDNYFKPLFSTVMVSKVTLELLEKLIENTASIKNSFTKVLLRNTLLALWRKGILKENLYDKLVFPRQRERPIEKTPLTEEELKQLFSYVKGHRLEHAIHLHFKTGIRVGELLGLYWSEIELNDNYQVVVHVNHSYSLSPVGFCRGNTKTPSSKRTVIVYDEYLWGLLQQARSDYGSKCKWVVPNTRYTTCVTHDVYNKMYIKIGKTLKFTNKLTTHIARHTFISHSLAKGIRPENIARMVGHTDTSMIYKVYGKAINSGDDWYKDFRLI